MASVSIHGGSGGVSIPEDELDEELDGLSEELDELSDDSLDEFSDDSLDAERLEELSLLLSEELSLLESDELSALESDDAALSLDAEDSDEEDSTGYKLSDDAPDSELLEELDDEDELSLSSNNDGDSDSGEKAALGWVVTALFLKLPALVALFFSMIAILGCACSRHSECCELSFACQSRRRPISQ